VTDRKLDLIYGGKMILSFKKQFKQKILDETKIHTIREDAHGRWKAGRKIHMATGVRTKGYDCFNDKDECISTQTIKIIHPKRKTNGINLPLIYIDDSKLNFFRYEEFAKNDGFDGIDPIIDFFKWFNKDFEGKIIHWTNLKY